MGTGVTPLRVDPTRPHPTRPHFTPPHQENAFRVERIAEIATKRYGLDPEAVLDNVTLARCLTHEHQQEMAIAAAALITSAGERYRLLVVDSIIGLCACVGEGVCV